MAVKKVRSKKKWSTGKLEKMQSEREREKNLGKSGWNNDKVG